MSKLKHVFRIIIFVVALCSMCSCENRSRGYVIGVSQCSEDSWRTKLKNELELSTYFNEDVQLVFRSANDDIDQQRQQIRELIDMKVDLLIVSPQTTGNLSDAITMATEAGIPVILFDRKSGADNYTAFMGADNYLIGQMLGEYAASQMKGRGGVIEIGGEHGSSPSIERHNGFNDAISKYPGIRVLGFSEGDWKQTSGELAMNHIIDSLVACSPTGRLDAYQIDCIFGANDRMAVGARLALEKYIQCHTELTSINPSSLLYLGVDALPTPGGGIEQVRDGHLTVSAIYPTHGDEVMALALNILTDNNFEKETMMETSLVTQANARVLLLQHREVERQSQYIKRMHERVDSILGQLSIQRIALFCIIIAAVLMAVLMVVGIYAYRAKHKLNTALSRKNDELNDEKAKVERQRDELEEQRDLLLDLTETLKASASRPVEVETSPVVETPVAEVSTESSVKKEENVFVQKFLQCVDQHISDCDLSVEDIGEQMCLSRVQLYRKIKAMTGKTPVEIIREERLKRAHILLSDSSLSISEIAYKVGFSAPSYFTKCYRDYYGVAPSGK